MTPARLWKRDENGAMLIEAVVSIFLMAIALSMTVIIVTVLTKNVANTTNTGTSADAAQSALLTLESYVSGVVSPISATEAVLNPNALSSQCWGSSNVAPEEGNTGDSDGWTTSDSGTSLNQSSGIIYAHDFAMVFCGYGSDSQGTSSPIQTNPNVYEIFINNQLCTSNNYCELEVVDLTPDPTSTTQTAYVPSEFPTADVPPNLPPGIQSNGTPTPGSGINLVSVIGRVWCDSACQNFGVACSSVNTAATDGLPVPSNYLTYCPAGYVGTPPLFNYYTSYGLGSSISTANQLPSLNWANAYASSTTTPLNVNGTTPSTATVGCIATGSESSMTFTYALCGPLDMYSPIDAQTVQLVQCLVLNLTVLGQNNPSASGSKSSSVNMTYQVWLRGLTQ